MEGRVPEVERELEARVEALAMELVELQWAGSHRRPILRIRIDYPDSEPGRGVTVGDCARVSRALEAWLDEHPAVPERYVLEVSSPGVERPLRRRRDWDRFVGSEVAVRGVRPLAGSAHRLQGELIGVEDDAENAMAEGGDGGKATECAEDRRGEGEPGPDPVEPDYRIRVRTADGTEARFRRSDVAEARLVFRWE